MRQISRSRVATAARSDLRAVEGILTASMLSMILWMLVLLLLH